MKLEMQNNKYRSLFARREQRVVIWKYEAEACDDTRIHILNFMVFVSRYNFSFRL